MEEDRVSTGRTLRRRKEKVAKHLKRGANEKEKENFQKRVFRIPLHKPFEEAYYTHRLWMFFRETREKEEDIRRMFCEAREKMRMRITLKKKSDPGQFAIPCTVKGIEFPHALCDTRASVSILPRKNSGVIVRDLEVQIGNALVPVDFHVLDIKLNWNSSLLLGRAFLSTVGAVCNLQTNQLCLTLIDPNAHYNHIPAKKPQTIPRRINDAGIIAACRCGAEYESDYSKSIDTHPVTSIDTSHTKSTDAEEEKSIDTCPDEWENDYYNPTIDPYTRRNLHTDEYDEDYEEERATEYRAILDEEDKLLHHSTWKRNAPSIDMTSWPLIDTQPQQRCQKRASTDTAYYKSVDTDVNHVRDGDYSIGSWADENHHESFAAETITYTPGADKLQDNFTDQELLDMQRRDNTNQIQAEAAWERTHEFGILRDPDGYAKAIDGHTLHVSRNDIADILLTANGANTMFMHQRSNPEQKATKESYGTAGGIDNGFIQRFCHTTHPSIDEILLGREDEYGIYRDDREFARDLDVHTIPVHNKDIRRLLERASRDEPTYICLPEHASSFTQTKLVPEIYTKDEINEMFYGVCGEHGGTKKLSR
ncbi:hypothetical protein F2Q68_00043021 [Brassica cretica]|uniref:Aspartic peptidase DDI1-type domain-containing protein n=1 Tax=Brassica cretica TaxID=69181 RepID=A0A8S9LTK3_BRACR|nr:hypothetical protein F2Q68_00043021 [Brassica cretica]